MIELTRIDDTKVTIVFANVVSVSLGDFGTRVAVRGGWSYIVKESYEEVLGKIRGELIRNYLETK